MGITPDYTLATLVHHKDNDFAVLTGKIDGDKVKAAEGFMDKVRQIFSIASDNTLCLMSNVNTAREQTAIILKVADKNNEVRHTIVPLAQELNLVH